MALDMWKHWKNNLRELINNSAQRYRLQEKGLDDCIDFCLEQDKTAIVPIFKDDVIISNLNQ
jgi:phosphosulfolactate phosphohydrolase-like enzyme